eukprot:PhM_4_TR9941/c0_g1_i1/m.47007
MSKEHDLSEIAALKEKVRRIEYKLAPGSVEQKAWQRYIDRLDRDDEKEMERFRETLAEGRKATTDAYDAYEEEAKAKYDHIVAREKEIERREQSRAEWAASWAEIRRLDGSKQ